MNENITRTELFAALQSLSDAVPQMRLGQLLSAIGELCADLHGRGLWDAADTELLEAVWQFHRNVESAPIVPISHEAESTAVPDLTSAVGFESHEGFVSHPGK